MIVLAIDPGTTESGVVLYGERVISAGQWDNHKLRAALRNFEFASATIAIEMIESFGMPVGREVFETVLWIGRFMEASGQPNEVRLVYRRDIKLHLCGSPRAKDANIRQALIDRLGAPGTKKKPGPTYGISVHLWSALAIAIYTQDTLGGPACAESVHAPPSSRYRREGAESKAAQKSQPEPQLL